MGQARLHARQGFEHQPAALSCLHTAGATGSIPVPPAIINQYVTSLNPTRHGAVWQRAWQMLWVFRGGVDRDGADELLLITLHTPRPQRPLLTLRDHGA